MHFKICRHNLAANPVAQNLVAERDRPGKKRKAGEQHRRGSRAMRLRIETTAPLPRLKTWLNVHTEFFFFGTRTFNDLCRRLATDFGLPSDIQLQYAGFDLYGKDPIESILSEDDLVQYAQLLPLKAYFSVILRAPQITEEKMEEVAVKANEPMGKRKRAGNESESEKSSPGNRTDSPDIKRRRAPSVSSTSSSEESSSDEESGSLPTPRRKPEIHSSSDSDSNVESNEDSDREIEEGTKPPKRRANVTKAHFVPTQTLDTSSETSSTSSTSSSNSSSDSESDSNDSGIHPPLKHVASKIPAFKTAAGMAIPPGEGSKRTHRRNQRKAMTRRLQSLIQQGTLPEGSTFVELMEYDNDGISGNGIMDEVEENVDVTVALEAAPVNKVPIVPGVADRIDVAAMQKYTKSEVRGSEGCEIAVPTTEEEASTPIQSTQTQNPTLTFVPRKLSAKAQKPIPVSKQALKTSDTIAKLDKVEDGTVPDDPFLKGFYEQVRFATEHRKALAQPPPGINGNLKSKHTALTVRAFECEPEWCGLAEPPTNNGEEVDSVEIDPPSLPFIDTYRNRNKNAKAPNKHPKQPLVKTPAAREVRDGWSEGEILSLVKMEKPRVGPEIYFKSMFLHPSRMEPVISWRWGKIVKVKGKDVDVQVYGCALEDRDDEDEEGEEGEVKGADTESFTWSELLDVRLR